MTNMVGLIFWFLSIYWSQQVSMRDCTLFELTDQHSPFAAVLGGKAVILPLTKNTVFTFFFFFRHKIYMSSISVLQVLAPKKIVLTGLLNDYESGQHFIQVV